MAVAMLTPGVSAETPDEFFERINREYDSFAADVSRKYESFRDKVNREYAEFMARPWQHVATIKPERRPAEPKPLPIPEETPGERRPAPVAPQPVVVVTDTVPTVKPLPRPKPIEEPKPLKRPAGIEPMALTVYGADVKLSRPDLSGYRLTGNQSRDFADGWKKLSAAATDNLLADCLKVREDLQLPDWHYLLLIERVASMLTAKDSNEKTLLTGYLLNQSGYDIRFARSSNDGRLHLLFNSPSTFYNRSRFRLDNGTYYAFTEPGGPVAVCDFRTPGESQLSAAIDRAPRLPYSPGQRREIKVGDGLELSVTVNRNLIDLMGDYPDAAVGASPLTRWTAYASMPASEEIRRDIYPTLRRAVAGLNQYEAVDLLLKVAQKFPYGYDSEIWGGERVFFMDESWHYPYSDCEDHAINFAHLVRDILGLEVCLVSYPNHLSAAVEITDGTAKGNIYRFQGKEYMSTDATYFGARAGSTMPAMVSAKASLIPVR